MKQLHRIARPALLIAAWTTACAAVAAPQTYVFSGFVDRFSATPVGAIALGDTFSGSFVYDAAAPALGGGSYDALSSMQAGVHGVALSTTTTAGYRDVIVTNGAVGSSDSIQLTSYPGDYRLAQANITGPSVACAGFASCTPYFLSLQLEDPSGAALSSTALPATLALQGFPTAIFYFNWLTPSLGQVFVGGTITALSAVPEPTTAALGWAGLAAVLVWLRVPLRRRTQLAQGEATRLQPAAGRVASCCLQFGTSASTHFCPLGPG